jgi:ATP-dependent RNA helicase RhlE
MSFEKLDLIEPILNALKSEGYSTPTPIQEKSIPIILNGSDLLGCAQTGTGKTAAFAIPILQQLYKQKGESRGERKIKALVVTPTRELAIQINDSFNSYGRNTNLRSTVIFGGVPQNPQVNALKAGVEILIATPGRLLDLIGQGYIKLNEIGIFVLDEADRMLDMGFVHDVKKILKVIPVKRQSLFFSATMPESIMQLAGTILTDPEKVEVTPVSSTAETIQQELFYIDAINKKDLLIHTLQDRSIITALVFTRTKHGADKVVKFLAKANIKAEAIHGNKSQNARQKALKNFKDHSTRVLVATDIAARGIDIDELAFVVNYEIPNIPETYVHRIGRTGRAGANGKAISFCDVEERAFLKDIEKLISIQIPVNDDHPFPAIHTIPEGKKKPQNQGRSGRSVNPHKKPQGNRAGGDTVVRTDKNPKKKWSWQAGK